jgi:thioredoxin-like negative regulator of GroEL
MTQRQHALHQNAAGESHGGIPNLDAAGFEAHVLQGQGPIAVEFMSYSCAYCGALEPVLQEVAQTLQSQVSFFRVNVVVEVDLASTYGISGTPTMVMFSNGQEVGRSDGPDPDVASLTDAVTAPFR